MIASTYSIKSKLVSSSENTTFSWKALSLVSLHLKIVSGLKVGVYSVNRILVISS